MKTLQTLASSSIILTAERISLYNDLMISMLLGDDKITSK